MSPHKPLPARPDLAHLKYQADDLRKGFASGDSAARTRIVAVPAIAARYADPSAPLTVSHAQLVIAREYGFDSWPALTHALKEAPMTPTTNTVRRDLYLFTTRMAEMMRSGLAILDALEIGATAVHHPPFAEAIRAVRTRLAQGNDLQDVLSDHPDHFDAMYVAMVAHGCQRGTLDEMLDRLARYQERGTAASPVHAFVLQLEVMTSAGLMLSASIPITAALATEPGLKAALTAMVTDIFTGTDSLPQAMAKHPEVFDGFIVGMIKAGDTGGNLDEVLRRVAAALERAVAFDRASGV